MEEAYKEIIFATIRKKSKYYHQQTFKNKKIIAFEVKLEIDTDPFWPVKGGPGGNYTLYDVDLWVKRGEEFLKLPLHERPE
jgi:hypothetical protein